MDPSFSIVIPTYNRPQRLEACLKSVTRLNYDRDRFEVIVVDDGSKKPAEAVVDPFRKMLNLKLLSQSNAGPAAARNTGVQHAAGEFIAFTDDDCMPARDWLRELAGNFAHLNKTAIGGKIVNSFTRNCYSVASQLHVDYLYGYYNGDPAKARFFSTANFALPTWLFREIGGFDTSFVTGEDREFCERLRDRGNLMLYLPEAVVYHANFLTLNYFMRQHFNYGRGAFRFRSRQAQHRQQIMVLEKISFYFEMLRYPLLTFSNKRQKVRLVFLLFLSQLFNTLGFLKQWASGTQGIKSGLQPKL